MNSDLINLSIIEIAEGIRSKQFISFEVTTACLEAAEDSQSSLNSFISISAEEALSSARKDDRLIGEKMVTGPLHGVP